MGIFILLLVSKQFKMHLEYYLQTNALAGDLILIGRSTKGLLLVG